jgi:hypothetical protein
MEKPNNIFIPKPEDLELAFNTFIEDSKHLTKQSEIYDLYNENFFSPIRPAFDLSENFKKIEIYRVVDEYDGIDITNPKSFSYNPIANNIGRAHIKNHPVFYGSEYFGAAISEIKDSLNLGGIYYLSKWEISVNKPTFAVMLLPTSKVLKENSKLFNIANNNINELKKIFNFNKKEANVSLMNYVTKLNDLFLIEGQEYYNLTSCIAHEILYNLRVDIDYTIDLLLYPSVELNQNELNYAIHPRLVDSEFMNIKEVYKFKLKEKKEDGNQIEVLQIGIPNNEKIEWHQFIKGHEQT